MDFDLEALRFYLEHEEATRLEREKFLNGEGVDLAIIPRGIYNSWVRSAAFGVNPYVTDVPAADGSVPARNTEQFFAAYQSPYNGLDFFRRKFRFQVFFTDRNGYTVSDEDPRAANPAAVEQNIGTTSAAMVLAERKSAPTLEGTVTFSSTTTRRLERHSASTWGSAGRRMAHSIPRVSA